MLQQLTFTVTLDENSAKAIWALVDAVNKNTEAINSSGRVPQPAEEKKQEALPEPKDKAPAQSEPAPAPSTTAAPAKFSFKNPNRDPKYIPPEDRPAKASSILPQMPRVTTAEKKPVKSSIIPQLPVARRPDPESDMRTLTEAIRSKFSGAGTDTNKREEVKAKMAEILSSLGATVVTDLKGDKILQAAKLVKDMA